MKIIKSFIGRYWIGEQSNRNASIPGTEFSTILNIVHFGSIKSLYLKMAVKTIRFARPYRRPCLGYNVY